MSFGSDSGNAELGIGITDAIAADARMKGKDGLAAQNAWARRYMGERIMGMAVVIALVATPIVYMYAGMQLSVLWTGLLAMGGVALLGGPRHRARKLDGIRAQQLADFRAARQTSENATKTETQGNDTC